MTESLSPQFVRFRCTHCSREIMAPASQSGQEIGCPACRAVLLVPAPGGQAEAPQVQSVALAQVGLPEVQEAPPPAEKVSIWEPPPQEAVAGEAETVAAKPAQPVAAGPASERAGAPAARAVPELPGAVAAAPPMEQGVVDAPAALAAEDAGAPAPPLPPVRVRPFAQRERPKPQTQKYIVIGGSLAAVLLVGVLVALSITRDMARQEKANALLVEAQFAEQAFNAGDLQEAGQRADALAKGRQELASLGGTLSARQDAALNKIAEQVNGYRKRLAELDALAAKIEKDPAAIGKQLRDQLALYQAAGQQARALTLKTQELIQRASALEVQRRQEALARKLGEAEQTYLKGDVEAALDLARQARTELAADERLKKEEFQKRLERLREYGDKLAAARRIRSSSASDLPGAQKKLADLAGKLDAKLPEHQPLLKEINRLLDELRDEERQAVNLNSDELRLLTRTAELLARREPILEVMEPSPAKGVPLRYENLVMRLVGLEKDQRETRLVMDAGGYRFRMPEKLTRDRPGVSLRLLQALARELRLAGVAGGSTWETQPESPCPTAWSRGEGPPQVIYAGKLYSAEVLAPPVAEEAARQELGAAAEELAQAVERDATTPAEVRATVVTLVRGAYKELDLHDFLPGEFCRRVLNDGYVEQNIPGAAARFQPALARYRKAYQAISQPTPQFKGRDAAGNELYRAVNFEDHALVRSYDAKADRTSFGIKHPAEERKLLFVVQEFAGRHEQFPQGKPPLAVRMVHPAVGVMAGYDPATGKLDYDAKKWELGAQLSTYAHAPDWMGEPAWAFPPHVLLTDQMGNTLGLVTTAGRVDLPHFGAVPDVARRRAAQEKHLDELARALNSTGYLHLYFLYFHQYVLDSPLETAPGLLGSRAHCGDTHQDAYQSLDRELSGRYLGDCDDLAELYMNLTRRQGKLSYVMSLPQHAACGWVDKTAGGYRLQFLDTGPPRIFEDTDLEKLVETGSRSYDLEKTMRFDPKSVPFLFRFAGEPTRTAYWLSCRMFYDRQYAEIMERVQSYWHFHFYALGIQTMEDMIAKGDRVPENCIELSGLYGRVLEIKKSVQWTEEALKQLGPRDVLSRLSEKFRVGTMYREDKDNEGCYQAVKDPVEELKRLSASPEWGRYVSQRLDFAGLLMTIDRPFDAWELLKADAARFLVARQMRLEHGGLMTQLYYKMQELAREPGRSLSDAEKRSMGEIERALAAFYSQLCFTPDDDFNDILRKYAFLGRFYGARLGADKLLAELLKDGPYPAAERDHRKRISPEEEDWKWIRLSPLSYALAVGEAIDPDDPPGEWRRDEAVKLAQAMQRAAEQARKFGSLASTEFSLLTTQIVQAFLTKEWGRFEAMMKEVERRNFARLTAQASEVFGECARFVTPAEFAAQYRVFAKHVETRAPYFNVVYEAYRAECYEHARAAAALALQRWPDDENMKREARYLEDLIRNRLKDKAEKEARAKGKK